MTLRLSQKAYILIAVPLFFELVFVSLLVWTQVELENAYEHELQAKQVALELNNTLRLMLKAGTYLLLAQVGGKEEFAAKSAHNYWKKLPEEVDRLKKLDTMSPRIEKHISDLVPLLMNMSLQYRRIELSSEAGLTEQLANDKTKIFFLANDMVGELEQVIEELSIEQSIGQSRQRELRSQLTLVIPGGVATSFVLAICLALFFNQSTLTRLSRLMENSVRFGAGKPLLPMLPGSDEIADLDRRFRSMSEAIMEANKRERAIISNSADVIFSLDQKLKFSFVSSASLRLWGYEPDELEGASVNKILDHPTRQDHRTRLLELCEMSGSDIFECQVRKKDGCPLDSLWSVYCSETETQLFCVAHDVTEQKQLQRMRQDFMNMISHDLKSPLNSLSLTFNMLLDGDYGQLNERGSKMAGAGERTIQTLVSMISDMLDIEKLEAGMLSIEKEHVAAEKLVEGALEKVIGQANKKKVDIVSSIKHCDAYCDPDRIVQVLVNLLTNSIKFSDSESTVELAVKSTGSGVLFSVLDSGRGIPEAQLDKVFDRFAQVKKSDSTSKGGTGLGLSICKALVEAHGGTISVSSVEGVGTTFDFVLPHSSDSSLE